MKRCAKSLSRNYILKNIIVLSVIIIFSGVFAFGLLIYLATLVDPETHISALWMLAMFPIMATISTPIAYAIIGRTNKAIDILTSGINAVASGNFNVELPVDDDPAFSEVYANFNKMAQEIRSVQTLKNDVADSFSHELKTPVSSINGCARLLLEGNLSEEKSRQYLKMILKDTERLTQFTQNFLLLSKLEAQEIVTDKENYNVANRLQECVIALEESWERKNIDICAELDEVEIFANRILLDSVWTNLLTNAIKYTPQGGKITVAVKKHSSAVAVSVADTGMGMSAEVMEHIFEKFYQGDNVSKEKGHGLGLSIVKRILELSGGKILVQSKEGCGSVFTVELPLN